MAQLLASSIVTWIWIWTLCLTATAPLIAGRSRLGESSSRPILIGPAQLLEPFHAPMNMNKTDFSSWKRLTGLNRLGRSLLLWFLFLCTPCTVGWLSLSVLSIHSDGAGWGFEPEFTESMVTWRYRPDGTPFSVAVSPISVATRYKHVDYLNSSFMILSMSIWILIWKKSKRFLFDYFHFKYDTCSWHWLVLQSASGWIFNCLNCWFIFFSLSFFQWMSVGRAIFCLRRTVGGVFHAFIVGSADGR